MNRRCTFWRGGWLWTDNGFFSHGTGIFILQFPRDHAKLSKPVQWHSIKTVRCRSAPHLVDREFPLVKMSVRLDTAAKKITLGSVRKQTLTKLYKEESSASVRDGLGALEKRLSGLENDRGGCRIYINGVLATSTDSIYFETA